MNTYGIPRYQEVNPALFAIIFFPFLFGVMFGDIGHGGVLFAIGIILTKNYEDLKKKDGFKDLLIARYLLLLMGFFAFFAGFIYNDFLSLPFNLFGSCFEQKPNSEETEWISGCNYPLGFDPKWYIATNELNFFNSFKMKFAVIVGVLQMSFGIVLKGANAIHFKNKVDFFFEFIP